MAKKKEKDNTKDSYPCKGVGPSLNGKDSSPAIWVASPQPLWFVILSPV